MPCIKPRGGIIGAYGPTFAISDFISSLPISFGCFCLCIFARRENKE